MAPAEQLSLFSETELASRAPQGFPVGCPTLDLATTWDDGDGNLFIYRPPGQAVSRIRQVSAVDEPAPEAVTVTWKPDGRFLAVAWSDGVVRLMGLENNRAAHHMPVCERPDQTRITHIGWASSIMADKAAEPVARWPADGASDEGALRQGDELPANLPQELTFLEVDSALPRISPLPSGSAGAGDDATVFAMRTGIEFLFQPPKREEQDMINVMVVGTDDGKLQLSVYDSFIIGTFDCPAVGGPSTTSRMVYHASNSRVSTHALVLATEAREPDGLHLVPMDLPFISSSPINLSLLASKLTTLQKLLRYLKQAQLHMQVEWRNARELPGRFLRSLHAGIDEMHKGPRDIVAALYHTVVTGHAYEPVRAWLVDSLTERGHKRWDKSVMSGLGNLRSLIHENFLPALDRCSIILSRLRGLAQFHDERDDIGFSAMQLSRTLDIISCLTLVGHKMLAHVMDELEHFIAFSTWLRFQIDRLASSASDELADKEATMDIAKVLVYLEKYLMGSPLDIFLGDISKDDYTRDWDHCEDGLGLLQLLDRQLTKHENGQASMRALPNIDFLVNYMTSSSNKIFKNIAESKKRSVRFGKPVTLSVGRPVSKMDMKMCQTEQGGVICTAVASNDADNKVYLFRTCIDIINGISTNQPVTSCCVVLDSRKVVDLKFLNDENLIVVCSEPDGTAVVVAMPIQPDKLPWGPYDADKPDEVAHISAVGFDEYRLPGPHVMKPVRMEVHDRSDVRGELPARICLLGSNRTTWRTYSMP